MTSYLLSLIRLSTKLWAVSKLVSKKNLSKKKEKEISQIVNTIWMAPETFTGVAPSVVKISTALEPASEIAPTKIMLKSGKMKCLLFAKNWLTSLKKGIKKAYRIFLIVRWESFVRIKQQHKLN